MGETVEITTWPHHQNLFYKITSSALSVEIQGESHALIGLSEKPGRKCMYLIGIGDNVSSWIKRSGRRVVSQRTPGIITEENYNKFWITWYNKVLRFGRQGEKDPIMQVGDCSSELKYITFSTMDSIRRPIHWRFQCKWQNQVAPSHEYMPIKSKITFGELSWVWPGDQLPNSAVIGGFENECLYVIKAQHRGSITPGKYVPSEGVGYISWGGQAHCTERFEVLCGFDCVWVPTRLNRIPVGAVEGGRSEVHSEPLYVGRAEYEGHWIPGKVQPSHKVCYIAYEGQEIALNNYEILVHPHAYTHSTNRTFMLDVESDNDSGEENQDYEDEDHMAYAF